jgi:DNA-binding transcriptional MerR regulator
MRIYPDNKIYYSIGKVAEIIGVTIPTLRVWEKEFDIIKPKKNRKGDRFFTVEDIENLKLIKHLIKEKGYRVEGAKRILRDEYKAAKDKMDVLNHLRAMRDFLESLKDAIDQRGKHKVAEPQPGQIKTNITTDEVDFRDL